MHYGEIELKMQSLMIETTTLIVLGKDGNGPLNRYMWFFSSKLLNELNKKIRKEIIYLVH